VPRTASRRRSADTETDDYLDSAEDGRERRGRRRDADPEEESPRGRRGGRSKFSDEPEDDPEDEPEPDARPPRRGERTSRSQAPREERSERGGRAGRSRGEKTAPKGRGGRSERGGRAERGKSSSKQGWGGYRQTADSVKSDFADSLKIVDNTDMLVKILDEEPIASYAEHWLTLEGGRRSFVCLGDDCPICNKLGDRPSVKVCLNVADMDVNPPEVKMWTFGSQVGDILEKFAENDKTSPLNRDDLYWTITRTKKSDRYTTTVRPVKARDLVEDFDTEPLAEDELDELEDNLFTEDQVFTVKTKAELNKVIEDNDLDDEY